MNYEYLTSFSLFNGIDANELKLLVGCLGYFEKKYEKGECIFKAGDEISSIGLIVKGSVNITLLDAWGKLTILDHIVKGGIFAETYACIEHEKLMVSVYATEETEITFLSTSHILMPCSKSCTFHSKLLKNMLVLSAQKNLNLSRRSIHTSFRTIRQRLMSFLSYQVTKQQSTKVIIKFNRQELADYLSVDRSALCTELTKMKNEDLIDFDKNTFIIKAKDSDFLIQ